MSAITNVKNISIEEITRIWDYLPDGCYISDKNNIFIDGNKAVEELIGYKKQELIGKSFAELKILSLEQAPRVTQTALKTLNGKMHGAAEYVLNRKDGNKIYVEIKTVSIKSKDEILSLSIVGDITESKRASNNLEKQAKELEKFNKLAIGRELKMIELKKEINSLLAELGRPKKY